MGQADDFDKIKNCTYLRIIDIQEKPRKDFALLKDSQSNPSNDNREDDK